MTVVLLILFAWGALDVAFVGAVSYISFRSARRRPDGGERGLRRLRIVETSAPTPHG